MDRALLSNASGKNSLEMKNLVTQNSLQLFVGSLFILSVVLAVLLFQYGNQTVPATNVRSVVASDTIAGDITIKNMDSL